MPIRRPCRRDSRHPCSKLGQREHLGVQVAFIADRAALVGRGPLVHVAHAVQMGINATQQHRSRRRAARMGVEVVKRTPALAKASRFGVPDLAADEPTSANPSVIAEDDDDVGPLGLGLGLGLGERAVGRHQRQETRDHCGAGSSHDNFQHEDSPLGSLAEIGCCRTGRSHHCPFPGSRSGSVPGRPGVSARLLVTVYRNTAE